MAKVSLRIYNREIEGLIDQGRTNEVIAHCQHILRTFSKHLATYRLLGKAYLESKRYAEAVDIFGRVLMSVPDDFVANVGMSIIRDEENKLDDAIWHMQRAFESQASNPAIQGELQRLYGRRDGMEPPKIRMTRGALAHMYVQGELYPQAIAEIRAVLAQEPDRADMQVLLARAYFRGGQKANASDMCAQLLKRYLYCFDANRIMVDLLPATAGAVESTQVYRMRVGELDPYATFSKDSVFQSDEVADAAINLERLEYKEEEPQVGQAWGAASLGSGDSAIPMLAATSSSEQPDWLKSGGFSDSQLDSLASSQTIPMTDSSSASQPSDGIPDFLRNAGWGESNSPEQPTSFFDAEPASGDLTPADIPDWLKGQVPSNMAQPDKRQPDPAQSIETPDWLSGLGGMQDIDSFDSAQPPSTTNTTKMADTPDWLSGLGNSQSSEATPAQSGNGPDSLTGFGSSQASDVAQPSDVPDWLSGLGNTQSSEPAPAQSDDATDWLTGSGNLQASEPIQAGSVPDWLAGLGDDQPEPVQAGNDPDWLTGLGDLQTSEPIQAGNVPDWLAGLGDAQPEPAQPVDLPDWMRGIDSQNEPAPQASAPSVESLGSTAQEQDDAVAWLESLAAKHGAKPEELVTDPNKRSETPPEWVSQAQNIEQQVAAPQKSAPTVESLGSTAQEQDDAVAWLESLAAKHGAKPEELVTDPNKRSETPPDWVAQAQNIEQQAPAPRASAPTVESLGSTAQEQDDAVAWLESLAAKHGAKPEELVTDPNKRSETPPDWVSQAQNIEQQAPSPQASAPTVESLGSTAQEQDDAVAWLESLAAKHGAKPEELVTDPNKRFDKPPEWVSQAQSIGEAQSASDLLNAEVEKSNPPSERVDNALNIGEQYFAEFENASTAAAPVSLANDETGMWLRDLEEKEKQNEFSAKTTNDVSDWSGDSQSQLEQTEKQNLSRSDIPEWLSDSKRPQNTDDQFDSVEEDTKDTFASQNIAQDDLSNWLSGLDDEPGLPFDGIPTPDSILAATLDKSIKKPSGLEPASSKSDLPDWLSNVDSQSEDHEDEWQKPVAQEPIVPASKWTEESFDQTQDKPEPVHLTENLPDWLQSMDEEEITKTDIDASLWLRQEALEEKEPQEPKPTSPSDWHPVESKQQPTSTSVEKKVASPALDARKPFVPQPVPPAEPFAHAQPLAERPVETRAPAKKKPGLPAKQRQPEGQGITVALNQAKGELDRGDIPTALDHYKKLIKKGRHLEETIRDLTESIYRYPVEVGIWQTLGDAYMRANRLKEALEAYNKAEELIR